MSQITSLLLILLCLELSFSSNNGISASFSGSKDLYTIKLSKKFFQKLVAAKSGQLSLPYLLSSPAINKVANNNEIDNKDLIPKSIAYKLKFEIGVSNAKDQKKIQLVPCSDQKHIRTKSIVVKADKKKKDEDDIISLIADKKSTSICFKVIDFSTFIVLGNLIIPLYQEKYIDWQNQYRFGYIHQNLKVGDEAVIRLHLTDFIKHRRFFWQNPKSVLGNKSSMLKMPEWMAKYIETNKFAGYNKDESAQKSKINQGHNEFRFIVTKPGVSKLKFVQRDVRNMNNPISVVIVKIVAK